MIARHLLLFCLGLLSISVTSAKLPLDADELKQLKSGNMVVHTQEKEDSSWNEWTVFALVNLEAEKALAIFSDYPYQLEYVPNLMKAEIRKEKTANSHNVYWMMDVPWPISNAEHVTTNTVKGATKLSYFELNWSMVWANKAKKSVGFARFYPLGKKRSLFAYRSYIVPTSALASLMRDKALFDLKATVEAIVDHLPKAAEDKRRTKCQMNLLRKRIGGDVEKGFKLETSDSCYQPAPED